MANIFFTTGNFVGGKSWSLTKVNKKAFSEATYLPLNDVLAQGTSLKPPQTSPC